MSLSYTLGFSHFFLFLSPVSAFLCLKH
uniref:Uncharacterized protein n=1 Tax=Arundo donax TaxID=35708 RepID=A0A0A9HXA4_ARUDO